MLPATTDVLIAGGGPCGLVLAIELGRRGIPVVLVDQDAGTILDSEEARELYAADLVLIRPDQIVAWRSNSGAGLDAIMRKLCGFFPGVSDSANLA